MVRQAGAALVVVLWVVAALSLLAASFGLGVRREARLAVNLAEAAKLRAAAEAGIQYAAFMLTQPDSERRFRADGSVYALVLDELEVRVQVVDEGGKVDLNQADEGLLRAILTYLTQDPDRAAALASAILDWRDGDRDRRVNGAEADDYRAAGLNYEPADAPFDSVAEVGLVLGMTSELTQALLPLVTVYSGQAGINPYLAPKEVLLALPGMDPAFVDGFVQARSQQIAGAGGLPLPTLPGVNFHALAGAAFGMNVEVRGQGGDFQLAAVVRPGQGVEYLDWRETKLPKSLFDLPLAAPEIKLPAPP
nr:general secretion pathway protein K [uncultured Gammaproteobacteria bacterium]